MKRERIDYAVLASRIVIRLRGAHACFAHRIGGKRLAFALGVNERRIREALDFLDRQRDVENRVCASYGGGGYWWASNAEEYEKHLFEMKKAGVALLARVARKTRVPLAEMLGQLRVDFSEDSLQESEKKTTKKETTK